MQLYVADRGLEGGACAEGAEGVCPRGARPGETRTVRLSVSAADLAYFDAAASGWIVEPITYTAIVGRHALDPNALRAAFRVA